MYVDGSAVRRVEKKPKESREIPNRRTETIDETYIGVSGVGDDDGGQVFLS